MVEWAYSTKSTEEAVQNRGTTSGHMSLGERCQDQDKRRLASELCFRLTDTHVSTEPGLEEQASFASSPISVLP